MHRRSPGNTALLADCQSSCGLIGRQQIDKGKPLKQTVLQALPALKICSNSTISGNESHRFRRLRFAS